MMPSVLELFARQILNENSDVVENVKLWNAAKLCLRNFIDAWSSLAGLA